ncbi:MAG: GIY-YIG nuclease family protein [Methylococcaceae bacterium]|nr:GIY-YIG nuclease family protein [Methylococcaceae bacterium]
MTDTTNLYLLIFPERRVVKIGKADDIHNRIQTLRRWWGEADYGASYHLSATQDVIFKLEKSLHFLLSQYAVPFSEGDGRSELFSVAALEIALKHIDLYCSSASEVSQVKKGIPIPLPISSPPRRRNKNTVLLRKARAMAQGVTQIAEQFLRIDRLLIVLFRKQARIAYQYDIVGHYVYFRLRMPDVMRSNIDSDSIMSYFSFDIEDFSGRCGINSCSVTGVGDVVQFRIRLPSAEDISPWRELLSYFSCQSELLLKKIPQRSSAATSPIPLLDESKVWNNILSHYEESER